MTTFRKNTSLGTLSDFQPVYQFYKTKGYSFKESGILPEALLPGGGRWAANKLPLQFFSLKDNNCKILIISRRAAVDKI